jgi:hypothetical protein
MHLCLGTLASFEDSILQALAVLELAILKILLLIFRGRLCGRGTCIYIYILRFYSGAMKGVMALLWRY